MISGSWSYTLITPARNEAENLARVGECLLGQTIRPQQWIVVDDGSTDNTRSIMDMFAASEEWVTLTDSPGPSTHAGPVTDGRTTGRDMVAFNAGLKTIRRPPSVVVKLDADLSFGPDYFARILEAFDNDPSLGITSGICLEIENGEWVPRHVTRSHVRGATRAYRWSCLEDVSPLLERLGWDTVDEIRALLKDWSVRSLDGLFFNHHRRMGARDGSWKAWQSQGSLAWFLGYRISYLLLRAIFRSRREPQALAMLAGWAVSAVRRDSRYHDPEVRRYLREQQRLSSLHTRVREALGISRAAGV
jgi:glycosyltransferase involved in cell wall biosynthesis